MRRALLVLALLVAGCGGEDAERELAPGRVRIGVAAAEPLVAQGARVEVNRIDNAGGIGGVLAVELVAGAPRELLARGIRLLVLPCRRDLRTAVRLVERAGAVAVAPCDDGTIGGSRRVVSTGLSPHAQAHALTEFVDGEPVRVLAPRTPRGRRVRALLEVADGGTTPVGVDAPEGVEPPRGAPPRTVYATYGFPTPGNRTDEFYERFRAVYGRRPSSVVAALASDAVSALAVAIESAASFRPTPVLDELREGIEVRGVLGDIEFPGGTIRADVGATIVRVEDGRLRAVGGG